MSTIEHTSVPVTPQAELRMDTGAVVIHKELRVYSHSALFHWWPVWITGYIMAALTYGYGERIMLGGEREYFHQNSNLGVIFFFVLFLVIQITNFSLRGLASGMVILTISLVTVTLAYMGLWNRILSLFGELKIHLNLGAYFWFSTLLFLSWAIGVFIVDRINYWQVTPGQLTRVSLFGTGSKSYNTQGMTLEKHRSDLFRNWLLGLGSGDLRIQTAGAVRESFDVPNVLFVGSVVKKFERLIAEVPDDV